MRVAVLTFGCRVNQAESQAIERDLIAAGCDTGRPMDADLIVVNSCSVTATADQGTRQSIRRVARENPSARIVVTGCYATRAAADVAALPGVVHVIPNERKDDAAEEALSVCSTWNQEPGTANPEPGTHPERGTQPGTRNPGTRNHFPSSSPAPPSPSASRPAAKSRAPIA